MTKWNMHDDYKTFRMVGEEAIEVANLCPVAKRTKPMEVQMTFLFT